MQLRSLVASLNRTVCRLVVFNGRAITNLKPNKIDALFARQLCGALSALNKPPFAMTSILTIHHSTVMRELKAQ
jgi:hypothetical protein